MSENIKTFLTDEDGKVINASIDNIADWKEVFENLNYKGERAEREWLDYGGNVSIGDCYFVVYNPQVSLDDFSPYFVVCCNTLQNGEKKKEWKEFKEREKERKEMDRRIKKRRKKKTNDIF